MMARSFFDEAQGHEVLHVEDADGAALGVDDGDLVAAVVLGHVGGGAQAGGRGRASAGSVDGRRVMSSAMGRASWAGSLTTRRCRSPSVKRPVSRPVARSTRSVAPGLRAPVSARARAWATVTSSGTGTRFLP